MDTGFPKKEHASTQYCEAYPDPLNPDTL